MIRSAIPDDQRNFLFHYVADTFGRVAAPEGDRQVPRTPCAYGDFAAEGLLKSIQPAVENHVGSALYPTYSYLRLYKHGDCLSRHVDRPACEISATLCLGYAPDSPWPIWIECRGIALPITLLAGDMLIYGGTETPHWRESYAGDTLAQVFLHYVDQKGPHRAWKFDKRADLRKPRQEGGAHEQLAAT